MPDDSGPGDKIEVDSYKDCRDTGGGINVMLGHTIVPAHIHGRTHVVFVGSAN